MAETLTSDAVWFSLIQVGLVGLTIIAFFFDHLPDNSPVSLLQRGDESQMFFKKVASVAVTFILVTVFQMSSFPSEGKVMLFILDLILVAYLFFYSGWFTNKLVGFKFQIESQDMNPRGKTFKE